MNAAAPAVAALAALGIMRGPLDDMGAVLAELAKRSPAPSVQSDAKAEIEAMAAWLRSRFDQHPKARGYCTSKAKRRAALATRRAGKSDNPRHESLARAIEKPGYRHVYCNETRIEAEKIAWRSDTHTGWLDLLEVYGVPVESARLHAFRIGGVTATVNIAKLQIDFSNGSQLAIFGADDERAINKLRGQSKDVVEVDEAQKFPHLRAFILQVVSPLLKDRDGEIWLEGTPAEDCVGYFYEVTCEPESGDDPIAGWEVHRWDATDNPHFGRVEIRPGGFYVVSMDGTDMAGPLSLDEAEARARQERWDRTAGAALIENGWTGEEPEFMREWRRRWVKADARFVYPVHAVDPARLTFAPMRLTAEGWYDHTAALADLPKKPNGRPHTWLYGIGADFGYSPDPFAVVVLAYTHDLPDLFEMFAWKKTKVLPDDQLAYLLSLWDVLDNVVACVGDPGGLQGANLEGWRERGGLPIDDADKAGKATWIELLGGDIRKGRFRYREGSPLLHEHKHLAYLPIKPGKPKKEHADRRLPDGTIPGNHCSDGNLYVYREMTHYLHRPSPSKLTPGSPEAAKAEEDRIESEIDDREQRRDHDEDADGWTSLGDDGGYQW